MAKRNGSKRNGSKRHMRKQKGGSIPSLAQQQAVGAGIMTNTSGPAVNLTDPTSLAGTKIVGGSRMKVKRGGSGLLDIVVPAALVYANQAYKPKNASVSFRKSRARHTRRNRRSSRRH